MAAAVAVEFLLGHNMNSPTVRRALSADPSFLKRWFAIQFGFWLQRLLSYTHVSTEDCALAALARLEESHHERLVDEASLVPVCWVMT